MAANDHFADFLAVIVGITHDRNVVGSTPSPEHVPVKTGRRAFHFSAASLNHVNSLPQVPPT